LQWFQNLSRTTEDNLNGVRGETNRIQEKKEGISEIKKMNELETGRKNRNIEIYTDT